MEKPVRQSKNSLMINKIQHMMQKTFMHFGNRLMINMIQHIMQKAFLQFRNILNDQCDIGHYVETIPVVRKQTYDQYDISHYVRTILVAHVVNSSIIYVHILPYHTLVLFLYMYLSEITFLTNSFPIILIIKILSYLIFCNGNACYQQCMFHECKLPQSSDYNTPNTCSCFTSK